MPDDNGHEDPGEHAITGNPESEAANPPLPPDNPLGQPAQSVTDHGMNHAVEDIGDRVKRGELWMIRLTAAIAFLALCAVVMSILQWSVMSGQLGEMKGGSADTHKLAVQAKNQADRTNELAVAAGKQADAAKTQSEQAIAQTSKMTESLGRTDKLISETHMLAQNAGLQATAMKQQLSLYTAAQTPFLTMNELSRSTESYGDDTLIKWTEESENSGGSKPLELKIWSDCHDAKQSDRLDFYRNRNNGLAVVIAPHSVRRLNGCETSGNFMKQLDQRSLVAAQSGSSDRFTMYVFGGAGYKDFLGGKHVVEYCYQAWWDNRNIDFGFQMSQCTPPNDGHNCTDEECKPSSPGCNSI
jgi:hypothetical protein